MLSLHAGTDVTLQSLHRLIRISRAKEVRMSTFTNTKVSDRYIDLNREFYLEGLLESSFLPSAWPLSLISVFRDNHRFNNVEILWVRIGGISSIYIQGV